MLVWKHLLIWSGNGIYRPVSLCLVVWWLIDCPCAERKVKDTGSVGMNRIFRLSTPISSLKFPGTSSAETRCVSPRSSILPVQTCNIALIFPSPEARLFNLFIRMFSKYYVVVNKYHIIFPTRSNGNKNVWRAGNEIAEDAAGCCRLEQGRAPFRRGIKSRALRMVSCAYWRCGGSQSAAGFVCLSFSWPLHMIVRVHHPWLWAIPRTLTCWWESISSISSGEKIDLTSASTIHAIRSASSSGVIEETSVQPADLLFLGREVHFCLKKFINTPSVKKNIRASIYGGSTCWTFFWGLLSVFWQCKYELWPWFVQCLFNGYKFIIGGA